MTYKTLARLSTLALLALAVTPAPSMPTAPKAGGEIAGLVEKGSNRVHFAVVSVENVPGSFTPGTAKMDQKDKEFSPHVLAVVKGTTVKFISSDPYFHNVFANSRAKTFNVSEEKKGDESDVVFDKVGIVPVRCHIHGNMKAVIVVLANPYFAVTNGQGLFRIPNVPPGTYTVKVWGEDFTSTTQSVTVTAGGQAKAIFKVN